MSADNTAMDIQPLAGVVLMCISYSSDAVNRQLMNSNGAITSEYGNTSGSGSGGELSCKILATNTNYFRFGSLGAGKASVINTIEVA